MISRRSLLAFALVAVACKREEPSATRQRCRHCGMKIDPTSVWTAELVSNDGKAVAFDTPRCALTAWRSGKAAAVSMRIREYYDASGPMRDAADLRFVLGGDVVGPMGPDLIPVDPSRVSKFIQDHEADRALKLEEITPDVLAAMK